ncbi:FMN-binding protein [Desulfitobacterium chlororespirans]|uniref:FMN-binding domain-containing protein n=1 Tax=Desulfitobacterium chlororespirans DSM 11544 TaxID=1121395 RepID=A0A1M7TWQ3_9FIRM|nr:FMN-binding protein [Desulfitobacterium chlororespirans]SHN75146.1 FMN-binding domain-containing protein [Desulfitobacterium chlororespirans DSM 11544]
MKNTKMIALMGVVLSTVVLLTGCGSQSADAGLYKDGTYEGSSDKGIHPGLKVSVTVQGGKIAEVAVVENQETPGVGSMAIEALPAKIVEAQSTEVEAVSGASLSSAAIKEAVDKALEQAKK